MTTTPNEPDEPGGSRDSGVPAGPPALSHEDRELLDFIATLPDLRPAVTEPVLFGRYAATYGNTTRVWQRLNALLSYPPALAYAPDTIGRLTRLRDQRRRGRRAGPTVNR